MKSLRWIIHRIAASLRREFHQRACLRRPSLVALGVAIGLAGPLWAGNIAPEGTAILGVNDAIDTDAGTPHFNAGVLANINDGNPATRVDDWFGGDPRSSASSVWCGRPPVSIGFNL